MDKSVDWRGCVYTALVCVSVPFYLPDRDKGQRRMRNEMFSYTHTRRLAVWCSASQPGDVSVCQMSEAREQGHLSCGGFDYVRRGCVISVDPLWQTLPLHYVTTAQVSQRPHSNCLSDSSTHSPHRSSAVLLCVCVCCVCVWSLIRSRVCAHQQSNFLK